MKHLYSIQLYAQRSKKVCMQAFKKFRFQRSRILQYVNMWIIVL